MDEGFPGTEAIELEKIDRIAKQKQIGKENMRNPSHLVRIETVHDEKVYSLGFDALLIKQIISLTDRRAYSVITFEWW